MNAQWKVVLAFIGVFIAGSVFGGFFSLRMGQQTVQHERPRAGLSQPMPPQPGVPPATQLLRRFASQLDLTDQQREKLKPIVDRAEQQIGRIRQTTLEQTDALLHQVQQDFRAELTADQRRKLDRMQERQKNAVRQERMNRQQQQGMGPNQPGGPFNPGPRPNQGNFVPPGPNQPGPNQPGPNQPRRPFQPQRPQGPPPQNVGPPQEPPPPGPERPAGEPVAPAP